MRSIGRLAGSALAVGLIASMASMTGAAAQPLPSDPHQIFLPLLAQAFTSAGRETGLELVGQHGGNTAALDGHGKRIYFGFGPRILVYERNPDGALTLRGRSPVLPSTIRTIVAGEDRLLAHLDDGQVLVMAVDAAGGFGQAGLLSAAESVPAPQPLQILLAGRQVITRYGPGVEIYDTSSPAQPERIAQIPTAALGACEGLNGISLYRGLLVSTCRHELRIHDISEPTSPRLLGSLHMADPPNSPTISFGIPLVWNQLAIVPTSMMRAPWLTTVDLSEPERPRLVSEWNVYSYDRVITNGSHVLARVRGGDIQLLDFSDPVQPRILDSISSPKGDFIGVSEGHLHFVSEFFIESVAVLDDGPMPSLAAGEPIDRVLCFGASFWNGQCVAGGGHILSYTASRICLLDLSDPGEPMPLGCSAVALSAERPLAAVSDRGAWLLDGSDLTAVSFVKAGRPLRIETRSLPLDDVWLPRNMQIVNGYLLLIRSPGADPRSPQRIELFDISEPLAPSRIVGIDFDAGPVSGPVEAGNQLWFAQGGRLSRIEPGGPGSATVLPVLEINPEAVLMSDGERLFLRQDLDGLTRLWPIAIEARAQLRIGEAVELRSSLRELSLSAGVAFGLTTSGTLLAFDLGRDAPGRVLGVLREPPYQRNRIGPAWRRLLDAREGRLTVTDVHGGVAIVQVRQ